MNREIHNIKDLPRAGMLLSVLHTAGAVQLTKGPSATEFRILVVGKGIPRIFDVQDSMPTYTVHGQRVSYPFLVPVDTLRGGENYGVYPQASGNYAVTADSRWIEFFSMLPGGSRTGVIPIHDRAESGPYVLRETTGRF